MKYTLLMLALGLAACSGSSLNIGVGGFGGNIGGSVSTEIPLGGDEEDSLPYAQIWLPGEIIESVFPDRELPFTANAAEVRALISYGRSDAEPGITDEQKELLADCVADKAKCQIQRKN